MGCIEEQAMNLLGLQERVKSIELLPHNQKLYNQIVEQMNNGEHSIFYSEGTGLGKSYVFMKLVEEQFKGQSILYIVPKIAIWDNLKHYKEFEEMETVVGFTTFAAFNTYPNDNILCENYDVVFIDECHHMLSDIQGKNVKQFHDDLIAAGKYVFGMTATPEIDGVFVDEECFDVSCYGLDMYEAIEQGLMPKMDIAIGIKEDLDIPSNLREKYSITGTQTLLDKVLSDYQRVTHWLAYFTTKEELEQNESEMHKLFPEYKILKIYQGCGDSSVIEEFENSEIPVILMSVSMFFEGMHLKNVGGVLLYRNVKKSHTYAQILGRLCAIGQKFAPVMVDVTGSILRMQQFRIPKSSRVEEGRRKTYTRKDIFDVTSKDYELLQDIEAFLRPAIKEYRGVTWRNQIELSSKLAGASTCASYLFKNPTKTEEDWIDLQLKDSSYEEFIANGRAGYYVVDGMKYSSISDVERQLGVYNDCIAGYLRAHEESTLREAVKLVKEGTLGKAIRNKEEEVYKGYRIHKIRLLAEDLGITEKALSGQLSESGLSIKEFIDQKVYRGVILNAVWIAQLVRRGYDANTIKNKRRQGHSVRACIDFALDEMYTYRGVQLGTLQNVAKQINIPWQTVESIYKERGFTSLEQIVDAHFEGSLIREYRGIRLGTVSDMALQLGITEGALSACIKHKGREYAIDCYLDQEEAG